MRIGDWLTAAQGKCLLAAFDQASLRGKRDYSLVAVLLGCGLRRAVAGLVVESLQQRKEHWVIADMTVFDQQIQNPFWERPTDFEVTAQLSGCVE